jgi:hypothetical protein
MRTKIAVASAILAAAALATGVAGGATGAPGKDPKLAVQTLQLEGTWTSRVTLQNPPPGADATFVALNTFIRGGRLLVSSSQTLPATRSLAHGEWARTGDRRFSSTFVAFRFDATGKFAGTLRVRRTLTLAPSLNRFESTDVVEFVAPDGSVVATLRATEAATRLRA